MSLLLSQIFREPLIETLGWTLIHFVWQGAAVAILLLLGLRCLRTASPNARYFAACLALLMLAVAPVATFQHLLSEQWRTSSVSAEMFAAATEATSSAISESQNPEVAAVRVGWDKAKKREPWIRDQIEARLPWLVLVWFGAVTVLSLRLAAGWFHIRRIRLKSTEPLDATWQPILQRMVRELNLSRPVALFKSAWVEVPTVVGWLKPVVLFPTCALTGLTPDQLETILAHELAHVRRHDYLVNLLQSVVETLLFYHPAVWWVSRQVRQERELCCDEVAVRLCGNRLAYARALATLEELRSVPLRLGMAVGGGSLLGRIRRLTGTPPEPNRSAWWVAGFTLAAFLTIASLIAQSSLSAVAQNATASESVKGRLIFGVVEPGPGAQETIKPIAPKLGELIELSELQKSQNGQPEIFVQFNTKGAELLAKITEAHIDRQLAIMFDGRTLVKPIIRERISGGRIIITGQFTEREAEEIVSALNSRKPAEATKQTEIRAATDRSSATSNKAVSVLIQDARLLIEMGKLDEAEAKLRDAVKRDPEHQGAFYYLKFIQEARHQQGERKREIQSKPDVVFPRANEPDKTTESSQQNEPNRNESKERLLQIEKEWHIPVNRDQLPAANPFARTNLVHTSKAREKIRHKLDNIILQEVFYDDIPLSEVVKHLSDEARKRDPDRTGINFIINSQKPNSSEQTSDTVDARTQDVSKVVIRINPPLRDVRLADVVEVICKVATVPMKYSIEDYAVVISQRIAEPVQLFTRSYKVEPNTFIQGLKKVVPQFLGTGSANGRADTELLSDVALIRQFFAAAGVNFPSGESETTPGQKQRALFYSDLSGVILVRAPLDELDLIEKAIHVVNSTRPQVIIEAKFAEITQADAKPLGFDWLLTGNQLQSRPTTVTGLQSDPQFSGKLANTTRIVGTAIRILPEAQYRDLIKALEQRPGVDVLSTPKVTTLSGRQARIHATEMKAVVLPSKGLSEGLETGRAPKKTDEFETTKVPVGPSIDAMPLVSADGTSIQLDVSAKLVEFLGYDDPGPFVSADGTPAKAAAQPLPRFRVRETSTTALVPDGHTLVLGGMPAENVVRFKSKVPVIGDVPLLGRFFRREGMSKEQKHVIIFVTPTIVDPAGNRVRK